jgi:hypothetical protein
LLTDGGYNVGTDASCFSATPPTADVASPAAAELTSLGNFGGPTQTVEPTAGNPAVPATGTPSFTQADYADFTLCPTTDQRGQASSAACDAGSVQGVYAPQTSANPTTGPAGYWLVGANGSVFDGSLPGRGITPAAPVVGITAAPGGGYWLMGADGGVFAFGGAPFDGSLPGEGTAVSNITAMAP